jgi:hypothetical protein
LARTTSVRPSGKFGMYYRDRKNPPSAKSPWLEKRVRGRMRRRPACGRRKDLGLVQSSQAACAEVHSLHAAVLKDRDLLNVRLPLPLGPHVRVTDTVSKGRSLATDIAFRHSCTSLTQIEPASTSAGPIQSALRLGLYHRPHILANRPGAAARCRTQQGRGKAVAAGNCPGRPPALDRNRQRSCCLLDCLGPAMSSGNRPKIRTGKQQAR